MRYLPFRHLIHLTFIVLTILATPVWAVDVEVKGAWVRATVPGQMATGAFMTLTAQNSTRLVGVQTPLTDMAQVHEMKMVNNVMQMRELDNGLELPAGKPVELKPGSYHIMLMNLKKPVPKDSTVAITLIFRDEKGKETRQTVQLPVAMMPMQH